MGDFNNLLNNSKKSEVLLVGKDLSYLLEVSYLRWAYEIFNILGITYLGEEQNIVTSSNHAQIGQWQNSHGQNISRWTL